MAINSNDVQSPQNRTFNPNEHLMQIKSGQSSKDYLPVQWRLVWFRSAFPHGTIETEMLHLDLDRETEEEVFVWNSEKRRSEKVVKRAKGFVVFKATVRDGVGGVATGTKSEKAASFPDYIEKAETGSIGRALAALGYGTQFAGDDWNEGQRLADAPADVTNGNSNDSTTRQQNGSTSNQHAPRTHQEGQERASKSGVSTTQGNANRASVDSTANASGHSSAKPSKPADPLTVRARGLYDLAIKKGKLKQGAAMDAWLTLCGDLVGANIMAIEHLTASRLDTIEQKLQQAS